MHRDSEKRVCAVLWSTLAALTLVWPALAETVTIGRHIIPGTRVTPSETQAYHPGAGHRFVVNEAHEIPKDMIVQGDTVVLRIRGLDATRVLDAGWTLRKASGMPSLTTSTEPVEAVFRADGYGENVVEFSAKVDGRRVTGQTSLFVEFSSDNMLVSGQSVPMPADHESNPFVRPYTLPTIDHREQCTARNPQTGRLVTVWQVNFLEGQPDDGPMGVAVMHSDDHGITWTNQRYLYIDHPNNSSWGAIGWSPGGNGGEGEFLLFTCSHVRSPENRLMLFRSRDNGDSWQHLGDYQDSLAREFGRDNALLTYFGVNRIIATEHGTLVAPMVSKQFVRTIWSDDNGATWHGSNLDDRFPQGNENAIVETVDGNKLILFARPKNETPPHNHRFDSSDGGRTWSVAGRSTIPTAVVNLGVDRITAPGRPYHGHLLHASAATRNGPHKGRQRTVLAINDDPVEVDPSRWDMRLLWDARANYSDVIYIPEDGSVFVSIETILPGRKSPLGYDSIRYFKLSYRYWQHLPRYSGTSNAGSP